MKRVCYRAVVRERVRREKESVCERLDLRLGEFERVWTAVATAPTETNGTRDPLSNEALKYARKPPASSGEGVYDL